MRLNSTAFADASAIPRRFTCDGADLSPPLNWSDAPTGTRSFTLLCDDPDAPAGTWHHWAAYDIPSTLTMLAEGETHVRAVIISFRGVVACPSRLI
jgi:Raf kinase inhibitor-like YbhB/YbcL family protein